MTLTITIHLDGAEVLSSSIGQESGEVASSNRAAALRPLKLQAPAWLTALEFHLTPREVEIVRMISTGMLYKQVAIKLGISERTVRGHLLNIYRRTGLQNNTMLVSYAWLSGILTEADVVECWRTVAPHLVELA